MLGELNPPPQKWPSNAHRLALAYQQLFSTRTWIAALILIYFQQEFIRTL